MDEHLGYEKNSVAGNNSGNSRNGYGKKTIISDYGECEIAVPRDRNGDFEPKVIEKRQTRTDEIEQKIMQMYAKGMSQRDIEDTLKQIYGTEISQGLVSRITDKILPEVNEWQNRPLEAYPRSLRIQCRREATRPFPEVLPNTLRYRRSRGSACLKTTFHA